MNDMLIWWMTDEAAPVPQWVRAFALQAEGLVFESHLRQTLVVKTGSDSSTPLPNARH